MSSRRSWICVALLLAAGCRSSVESSGEPSGGRVEAVPARAIARPPVRRARGHFRGGRRGRPAGSAEDAGDLEDGGVADAGADDVGFWWIGAESTETSAIPNNGVRATIEAVTFAPDGGCFDCWTSNLLNNGYWGQVGFSSCDPVLGATTAFTAFYQVWNDVDPNNGILLVDGETTAVTAGNHEFAMNVQSGNVWAFAIDGVVFGTYDMGSNVAEDQYAVATLCEEGDGVSGPFVPPRVAMPAAMDILHGGSWAPAAAAYLYDTAGLSGAIGHLQDALVPDEGIFVGGDAGYVADGGLLWSSADGGEAPEAGAPANPPAFVVITSPAALATVTGTVAIDSTVTSATAIDNVAYYVESATSNAGATPCTLTLGPYDCAWNTTALADGQYYVTVQAEDVKGFLSWADIEVTIDNAGAADGGVGDGGEPVDGGGLDGAADASDSGTAISDDAGDAGRVVADGGTPGGEDGGAVASEDGGSPGVSAVKGCSCEVAGGASGEGGWGGAAGVALLLGGRRRRRSLGR